jgi:hypothetical protein
VGRKVLVPLRACVNAVDYCNSSSVGTLTHAKSLVMCVETFCHCVQTMHSNGLLSFVLVRTSRSSCIALSHLIRES